MELDKVKRIELLEKQLSDAKSFKMNPAIRFLGIIIGIVLVVMAFSMIKEAAQPSSDLSHSFLLIIFSILSFGMGCLFSLYSFPGKTPSFLIKRLKSKLQRELNR